MGIDPVITPAGLARLVAARQLRYVYWDPQGRGGRFGQQPSLSSWLTQNCQVVPGFETTTANAGAPDGTGASTGPGSSAARGLGFGGAFQVSLYDCAP